MTTPVQVQLSIPVTSDGFTITELVLRRPRVRDLRALEAAAEAKPSQLDQGAALLALLAGITEAVVEELDATDFARASQVIAGFFEAAKVLPTGAA